MFTLLLCAIYRLDYCNAAIFLVTFFVAYFVVGISLFVEMKNDNKQNVFFYSFIAFLLLGNTHQFLENIRTPNMRIFFL